MPILNNTVKRLLIPLIAILFSFASLSAYSAVSSDPAPQWLPSPSGTLNFDTVKGTPGGVDLRTLLVGGIDANPGVSFKILDDARSTPFEMDGDQLVCKWKPNTLPAIASVMVQATNASGASSQAELYINRRYFTLTPGVPQLNSVMFSSYSNQVVVNFTLPAKTYIGRYWRIVKNKQVISASVNYDPNYADFDYPPVGGGPESWSGKYTTALKSDAGLQGGDQVTIELCNFKNYGQAAPGPDDICTGSNTVQVVYPKPGTPVLTAVTDPVNPGNALISWQTPPDSNWGNVWLVFDEDDTLLDSSTHFDKLQSAAQAVINYSQLLPTGAGKNAYKIKVQLCNGNNQSPYDENRQCSEMSNVQTIPVALVVSAGNSLPGIGYTNSDGYYQVDLNSLPNKLFKTQNPDGSFTDENYTYIIITDKSDNHFYFDDDQVGGTTLKWRDPFPYGLTVSLSLFARDAQGITSDTQGTPFNTYLSTPPLWGTNSQLPPVAPGSTNYVNPANGNKAVVLSDPYYGTGSGKTGNVLFNPATAGITWSNPVVTYEKTGGSDWLDVVPTTGQVKITDGYSAPTDLNAAGTITLVMHNIDTQAPPMPDGSVFKEDSAPQTFTVQVVDVPIWKTDPGDPTTLTLTSAPATAGSNNYQSYDLSMYLAYPTDQFTKERIFFAQDYNASDNDKWLRVDPVGGTAPNYAVNSQPGFHVPNKGSGVITVIATNEITGGRASIKLKVPIKQPGDPKKPGAARVIGYLQTSSNSIPTAAELKNADYTHIIFAAGLFCDNVQHDYPKQGNGCLIANSDQPNNGGYVTGSIYPTLLTDASVDWKSYISDLKNSGITVLLSIGGTSTNLNGTTVYFSDVINSPDRANTMIGSIKSIVDEYKFDGIDFKVEEGLEANQDEFSNINQVDLNGNPYGNIGLLAYIINTLHTDKPDLLISLAPQVINISTTSALMGQSATYSSLIMKTHNALNWVGVQLYDSEDAFAINGNKFGPTGYNSKLPINYFVAMPVDILETWPTSTTGPWIFQPLPYKSHVTPDQVVLGYLSVDKNGGFAGIPDPTLNFYNGTTLTAGPNDIKKAIHCLSTGNSCDQYKPPKTYNGLGGVLDWDITHDQSSGFQFSRGLQCVISNNC